MGDMRADMGGAAVTVAAMKAIAQAGLKGRIVALTPLAENMPAGNASKPGDVVVARNGKTIQIDNTDAEGRLLLCDTLGKDGRNRDQRTVRGKKITSKYSDYAAEIHKPTAMIDSATLTGAMVIALGSGATGVFCKNDNLWSLIEKSGYETGDRAWRMPHYKHYFGKIFFSQTIFDNFLDSISPTHNADLNNTGGREAGSATAAAFLADFVPDDIPYAHFDIAGVGGIFRLYNRFSGNFRNDDVIHVKHRRTMHSTSLTMSFSNNTTKYQKIFNVLQWNERRRFRICRSRVGQRRANLRKSDFLSTLVYPTDEFESECQSSLRLDIYSE